MTSLIAWDQKAMSSLITMSYGHIYVDVIRFVSNCFLKIIFSFVIYFIWMVTSNHFWHTSQSSGVICQDAHEEGRESPEWAYMGPMRMLPIYFFFLIFLSYTCANLYIDYIYIYIYIYIYWQHTGDDDTEFIEWPCCYSERVRRHGALGTEWRVQTGAGEAWISGEGSASWGERYSCMGTSFSYRACSQAGPSQCTSHSCSIHEGKIATMEVLLRAQTERNEALEQRMRHFETFGQRMRYFEAVLTSMGVSHTSPSAQQSSPPNGGSTSSVYNSSVGMITIV
jgi:hypothetical protein